MSTKADNNKEVPTVDITIIPTEVPRTSAAHLVIDGEPLTIVWSTIPVACTDWLLGDVASQGPVRLGLDQVPDVWKSSNSGYWHAIAQVACGTCGQMVGPWAVVHNGHLIGDELVEAASEIAELAEEEREWQRGKLIASLAADAEDVASQLAEGTLTREEVPDLGAMSDPGVGVRGDEVVAWACMPNPDGGDDPEIVEVSRPIFEIDS